LEYVMAFSGHRGRRVLGDGSTRESVAAESRIAAVAFMNGVTAGWDKLDLALWLTGPYARATRHLPRGERVTHMAQEGDVRDETIDALVTRVRSQILAQLETAALAEGTLTFAVEAMDRGFVLRALDWEGEIVWVPADLTRMHLKDRVRALFAADYLNDPSAYATLYVCHRCEHVVFDESAKRLGACADHARISHVVPRPIHFESGEAVIFPFAAGDDD
jgi:hypothetical protein